MRVVTVDHVIGSAAAAGSQLLERDYELGVIDAIVAGAQAGRGRVIVVEAPAGCGKSALLAAAIGRANGLRRLAGRGGEFERAAAFGVVRDLYGPALTKGAAAGFLGAARLAAPLFEAAESPPRTLDAASVNHGLYWLTATLAADEPLVLTVDDAQWADVASLRYFEHLAARLDSLPCALVLAWRPGEPDSDEAFVGRVLEIPDSVHLQPRPLSREASRALLVSRLPRAATDAFVARVHRATGGNPFLLHEFINSIASRSGGDDGELSWLECSIDDRAIQHHSDRLLRILRARLARLPAPSADVAAALSVLGPGAALRHAAGVAGVAFEEAARAADWLAAADLILVSPHIDFVHPLIRRAIYDMQPPLARAEAHRRAADLLAAEQADSEVVAGHLLAAPAGGDQMVVKELRRAAAVATGRGGTDAAVAYLRRALDEPPGPDERIAVVHALGSAEVRAGIREGLERLRAVRAGSDDRAERLALALEISHWAMAFGPQALAGVSSELSDALAESGDDDSEIAMLARSMLMFVSIPTASTRWTKHVAETRALYRRTPDSFGRRVLAATLAVSCLWCGQPIDDARALARYALADDDAHEQALQAGWQLSWCCPALAIAGDWQLAERRLEQALMQGQQQGSPRAARNALWNRAAVRARRGDLAGAEADGRQALELHDDPTGPLMMFGLPLADVLIDRTSPTAAQEVFDELGLDNCDDSLLMTPQLRWSRARLRLAQSRPHDAMSDLTAARDALRRAGLTPTALFSVEELAVTALAATGHQQRARDTADEALQLARRHGTEAQIGTALRARALLHRGPEQIRQLAEAAEFLQAAEAPIEYARVLIDLGAALRRQRERAAARAPLAKGRDLAHRCGALALVERATQELRAAGGKPRRVLLTGAESLTASERRVAEMAASGLTSRVIAEQLFVTQKTVEAHLGHVYRKLGIPGRRQIANALQPDARR